ncbi:MAG: poly(A)-specific ribonuclease [Watsoniomyces obsoletus]|nr:MAG: poly(A)-specific ribonuclease [Watsoniomyces obsoletus]
MTSAAIVGSTGQVGSHILSLLLELPNISSVTALARRPLQVEDASHKLNALVEPDSSQWGTKLRAARPTPQILFSGLGTTRAQAKGLENQRKIDFDLNMEVAKAAKESGTEVYVLISSAFVSTSSMIPYSRLKAEIEEAAKALDFKHLVLVKPGLIVGDRSEAGVAEVALRTVAKFTGKLTGGALKNFWAQDKDVIAKAAVSAGMKCLEGQAPGKVWLVEQADIVRLGQTEWKKEHAPK